MILVEGDVFVDGSQSLDLSVGEFWIDTRDGCHYTIPSEGVTIPPQASVVISTHQRVQIPPDVFGLVMGKGRYIFDGLLVSPGKIDPHFVGRLRIGVFNSSRKPIVLKQQDRFCAVSFIQMEEPDESGVKHSELVPNGVAQPLPLLKRVSLWMQVNGDRWFRVVAALITLAAALIAFHAKSCSP
jgi:dUTPase